MSHGASEPQATKSSPLGFRRLYENNVDLSYYHMYGRNLVTKTGDIAGNLSHVRAVSFFSGRRTSSSGLSKNHQVQTLVISPAKLLYLFDSVSVSLK
jgi:hypothetical protein